MKVAQRDVLAWLNPWPIRFRSIHVWTLSFRTVKQCLRYQSFWHVKGRRVTAKTALTLLRGPLADRLHHIEGMARNPACFQKPVLMVHRNVIVDGNHTLLALARKRYRGKVLVLSCHR